MAPESKQPKLLYAVAKWAGAIITLGVLGGWMSSATVRLHKLEEQANQVPSVQHDLKIIKLTLKLLAPDKYKQAEDLAK